MRISPAVFEVQAGTRLMLDVTNADAMRHDLLLATGQDRGTAFRVVDGTFRWCSPTVPIGSRPGTPCTVHRG